MVELRIWSDEDDDWILVCRLKSLDLVRRRAINLYRKDPNQHYAAFMPDRLAGGYDVELIANPEKMH